MGLGEGSGHRLNFGQAKNLYQHLQNYDDTMAAMKVSHTVYVKHIIVLLKIWAKLLWLKYLKCEKEANTY